VRALRSIGAAARGNVLTVNNYLTVGAGGFSPSVYSPPGGVLDKCLEDAPFGTTVPVLWLRNFALRDSRIGTQYSENEVAA